MFEENKRQLDSLRDRSRRPQRVRRWEVSVEEEDIVYALRNRHMRYGKKKLKRLCLREHGLSISTWKIERVIRKHRLYIDPIKRRKIEVKRAKGKANPRIRVHSLPKPKSIGALWHVDSVIINVGGVRRAIVTSIDELSKIAYARMYTSNTSSNTKDFVNRLLYLTEGEVSVLHTDNGSEFDGQFAEVVKELGIGRVYSRPHTPKDNPVNERFNRTIQEEWLEDSEVDISNIKDSNKSLTQWLIEYNTYRPHESLDQLTPLEYVEANIKVLPMSPACTRFDTISTKEYKCYRIDWRLVYKMNKNTLKSRRIVLGIGLGIGVASLIGCSRPEQQQVVENDPAAYTDNASQEEALEAAEATPDPYAPEIKRLPGLEEQELHTEVVYTRYDAAATTVQHIGLSEGIHIEALAVPALLNFASDNFINKPSLFIPEDMARIAGATLQQREPVLPITVTFYNGDAVIEAIGTQMEEGSDSLLVAEDNGEIMVTLTPYANMTDLAVGLRGGATTFEVHAATAAAVFKACMTTKVGDPISNEDLTDYIADSLGVAYALAEEGASYESYLAMLLILNSDGYGYLIDDETPLAVSPEIFQELRYRTVRILQIED